MPNDWPRVRWSDALPSGCVVSYRSEPPTFLLHPDWDGLLEEDRRSALDIFRYGYETTTAGKWATSGYRPFPRRPRGMILDQLHQLPVEFWLWMIALKHPAPEPIPIRRPRAPALFAVLFWLTTLIVYTLSITPARTVNANKSPTTLCLIQPTCPIWP
jgi:hypothetical protein